MAQRKMKRQALKPKVATKSSRVRLQMKRATAEMRRIREDKKCIREEQSQIRGRFYEIERQCEHLKEETEMIVKQTAHTQIKVALMFKILKAREAGDSVGAAALTHFLREFVSKERANASWDEVKGEQP